MSLDTAAAAAGASEMAAGDASPATAIAADERARMRRRRPEGAQNVRLIEIAIIEAPTIPIAHMVRPRNEWSDPGRRIPDDPCPISPSSARQAAMATRRNGCAPVAAGSPTERCKRHNSCAEVSLASVVLVGKSNVMFVTPQSSAGDRGVLLPCCRRRLGAIEGDAIADRDQGKTGIRCNWGPSVVRILDRQESADSQNWLAGHVALTASLNGADSSPFLFKVGPLLEQCPP